MNKATKIERGDTVRILRHERTEFLAIKHLIGETLEVQDTIRRYKSSPARVSVYIHGAEFGCLIDLPVDAVEKIDDRVECGDCGALVEEDEILIAETEPKTFDYPGAWDAVGCVECLPEQPDADTIGDIQFHEARDEPESFGGRLI